VRSLETSIYRLAFEQMTIIAKINHEMDTPTKMNTRLYLNYASHDIIYIYIFFSFLLISYYFLYCVSSHSCISYLFSYSIAHAQREREMDSNASRCHVHRYGILDILPQNFRYSCAPFRIIYRIPFYLNLS